MTEDELKIENLIHNGYLEKVNDMVYLGQKVKSSILGYRITQKFVKKYFARIFDSVENLFPDEVLHVEKQSMEHFARGVNFIYTNIVKVVNEYFEDKSYNELIEPLQILFQIIKLGEYKGMNLESE